MKTQYDPRLRAVSEAIQQVEAPGDYFTMGTRSPLPLPGLAVDGVGDVAVPLTNASAQALIAASHLASFGHGEQTLVDTQVRNTWELSTNQFRLENAAFSAFVKDEIAEACRVPLGIHASVAFEAKLYKLLLYETGGKFDQHQDSEKESGMFGTLVVVLPGRFEGGELVVHHPSPPATRSEATASTNSKEMPNAYEFDAAAMDPFALKYAAFYGDCPHEVKPVSKGYRLCLTYNLVKVANSTTAAVVADPHFGSNHVLYKTLQSALDEYFCVDEAKKKKRQRLDTNGASAAVGFNAHNPDTHRQTKLVYVTTHKYTDANLSFRNLKNRDAAVASSLARYCDASDGLFGLLLCKIKFRFNWHGEEGTMYRDSKDTRDREEESGVDDSDDNADDDSSEANDEGSIRRNLDLLYPWVQYTGRDEVPVDTSGDSEELEEFSEGDLLDEVAPCGVFHRKDIKFDGQNNELYTGNEGASSDRWYTSAALVVAPLQMSTAWALYGEDPSELLQAWFKLADLKPANARAIARAFSSYTFEWSTTSPLGIQILETLAKLEDADGISAMLAAFASVEFQPKLRNVVAPFDGKALAKTTGALAERWDRKGKNAKRNICNFIASALDGVTDPTKIAAVLDAVNFIPSVKSDSVDQVELSGQDTTPEEFARVLQLASLVSDDRVKAIVDACKPKSLVLVGAPAIRLLFAAARDQQSRGAVVLACANHVLDMLKQSTTKIRKSSYWTSFGCPSYRNCACKALGKFLGADEEVATFDKKDFESHLKEKLENAELLDRFSVTPSNDSAESKVVVKKTYESPLFKKAQDEIANLNEMVAEFVRVAVLSGARGQN